MPEGDTIWRTAAALRTALVGKQIKDARPALLGRPVQLEGLAQVVGLAIGAPEFQRR